MSGTVKLGIVTVFMALGLVCGWLTAVQAQPPLVWVTDDTPGGLYIIGGGAVFKDKMPGIEIELYRMAAEKLNLTVTFKRFSWTQCLYLIGQNKVDGIFPASFKKERLSIGAFPMKGETADETRMTRNNAYYLYQLKNSPAAWNGGVVAGAKALKFGVPRGWAIVDTARDLFGSVKEETLDATIPNLLIHNRLDGFICLETVFDAYLAQGPADYAAIVKIRPAVQEKPYYLMLSRQFAASRPELAEGIWDAIREIRQTTAFQQMVDRYVKEAGKTSF